jgi:hypothetical protein
MMHKFHKSLGAGKAGETAFLLLASKHGLELTQTDGRSGDFVDSTGHKYELKTDSYSHDKTENFFIETFSDVDKLKVGGPAQALAHGCKYYCYYFPSHQLVYVFDTANLLQQLSTLKMGPVKYIKNVRWTTTGFAVPRKSLSPITILNGSKQLLFRGSIENPI